MDINNLQFIQGEVKQGEVATIKFFDSVTAWTVSSFVDEFTYLERYVKPSLIRVLINSEGGSVLRGMSAFSAIINSGIPTETIVEGLAASMGSVLLAAGNVAKMRDYGFIMLHNPFAQENTSANAQSPMVLAFQEQLKTIYKARWGFTEEAITEIMTGKDGNDGTWFNADRAVSAGIISADNVIKTSKQQIDEIMNSIGEDKDAHRMVDIFASVDLSDLDGVNNQTENKPPNVKREADESPVNKQNNTIMNKELEIVASALSMDTASKESDVIARITELGKVEASLAEMTRVKAETDIKVAGLETSLANVQASLLAKETEHASVLAELNILRQAEAEKVAAEHDKFIDAAIEAGKITAESKSTWVGFAKDNFDMVKATIESMVGKVKISAEITEGAAVLASAQLTETEKEAKEKAEKIKAVVGDITLETLNK